MFICVFFLKHVGLRGKLNDIISLEYLIITIEIKALVEFVIIVARGNCVSFYYYITRWFWLKWSNLVFLREGESTWMEEKEDKNMDMEC